MEAAPRKDACFWVSCLASCVLGHMVFLFLLYFFYFFILLALRGLCCRTWTFPSCGKRGYSSCSTWASHFSGFSCCRARALRHSGFSTCSMRALECGLSSSAAQAELPCGMWNLLPGRGIQPVSPAGRESAGRFSATGPPGKFQVLQYFTSDKFLRVVIPRPGCFPGSLGKTLSTSHTHIADLWSQNLQGPKSEDLQFFNPL